MYKNIIITGKERNYSPDRSLAAAREIGSIPEGRKILNNTNLCMCLYRSYYDNCMNFTGLRLIDRNY